MQPKAIQWLRTHLGWWFNQLLLTVCFAAFIVVVVTLFGIAAKFSTLFSIVFWGWLALCGVAIVVGVTKAAFNDGAKAGLLRIAGGFAVILIAITSFILAANAFKTNPLLFAVIWVCAPVSACLVWVPSESPDDVAIRKLRTYRSALMTGTLAISFLCCASMGLPKSWSYLDESIFDFHLAQTTWAVGHIDAIRDLISVGVFAVPVLTWCISTRGIKAALWRKEREQCVQNAIRDIKEGVLSITFVTGEASETHKGPKDSQMDAETKGTLKSTLDVVNEKCEAAGDVSLMSMIKAKFRATLKGRQCKQSKARNPSDG